LPLPRFPTGPPALRHFISLIFALVFSTPLFSSYDSDAGFFFPVRGQASLRTSHLSLTLLLFSFRFGGAPSVDTLDSWPAVPSLFCHPLSGLSWVSGSFSFPQAFAKSLCIAGLFYPWHLCIFFFPLHSSPCYRFRSPTPLETAMVTGFFKVFPLSQRPVFFSFL